MIGWLVLFGISGLIGGLEGIAGLFALLGLAVFFPRLTRFLFATVAFPVWTAFVSTWMLIIGWTFSLCSWSLSSFYNCILISIVPVGITMFWLSNGVAELAEKRNQ